MGEDGWGAEVSYVVLRRRRMSLAMICSVFVVRGFLVGIREEVECLTCQWNV